MTLDDKIAYWRLQCDGLKALAMHAFRPGETQGEKFDAIMTSYVNADLTLKELRKQKRERDDLAPIGQKR